MITVENLNKTFKIHRKEPGFANSVKSLFHREWRENHALRDISLNIEKGEIVGLIGANGAGKTTLVKVLSGIVHPDSGVVKVLNHTPHNREDSFRRQISLIMGQKAQLWWDLPAGDSFLLLREIYQIPKKTFQERLAHLTETLSVGDKMDIQLRRLSLGERMKMELIAALLHTPQVVFLDEPTIGLDITAQRAIRQFITEYRGEHSPAMILTSHYMEDIESLCKRIIIMREGRIIYDGPLKQIVDHHAPGKVLALTLDEGRAENFSLPTELGKIESFDKFTLNISTTKEKLAEATAFCMNNLSVLDLSIEEPDIASIIESIMRGSNE